jgi:hypothetical protein
MAVKRVKPGMALDQPVIREIHIVWYVPVYMYVANNLFKVEIGWPDGDARLQQKAVCQYGGKPGYAAFGVFDNIQIVVS